MLVTIHEQFPNEAKDLLSQIDYNREIYVTVRSCGFGDEYYVHYEPRSFGGHTSRVEVWLKECRTHIKLYNDRMEEGILYVHPTSMNYDCCNFISMKLYRDMDTTRNYIHELMYNHKCPFCFPPPPMTAEETQPIINYTETSISPFIESSKVIAGVTYAEMASRNTSLKK